MRIRASHPAAATGFASAVTDTAGQMNGLGPERERTAAQFAIGVAAGIGMVAVWGSWAAITRKGALEIDLPVLVLIRFLVPGIVFLPVTLRVGLVPVNVRPGQLVIMVLGSGVFFFLCAAWALWLAPVAEVGPLMPATPPLLVALYMALWHGHKFRAVQIAGLTLITLGIVVIVGWHIWQTHEILVGHFLALLAAALWAAYTVAFRRSGMTALECAAVVSAWSAFVALPFGIAFLIEHWQAGRHVEVLAQVAMQGVASGVIAVLLYGISIRTLGAPEAAAMVALSSVVSVALAVPLLGEYPGWITVIGILAMTAGVVMTNWRKPKSKPHSDEVGLGSPSNVPPRVPSNVPWRPASSAEATDGHALPTTENADLPNADLPDWLTRPARG
jgi:drug/metabolite transporter (DMT)-like permease